MLARLHSFEGGLLNEFRCMENIVDQLFSPGVLPRAHYTMARNNYPPINIGSTSSQVDVYMYIPGMDPERLDISINKDQLMINGERRTSKENKANCIRSERYDGAFNKVINLPDDVDADKVEASYNNGVLHIIVQRRESAKPRQITIQ
jgi:HSP20 family protein